MSKFDKGYALGRLDGRREAAGIAIPSHDEIEPDDMQMVEFELAHDGYVCGADCVGIFGEIELPRSVTDLGDITAEIERLVIRIIKEHGLRLTVEVI